MPDEEIRERLTKKGSPLQVVGWRRLRQIFHQGEGVFWERDSHGRLWLRSALRIALELDCDRLKGKRVELPINALLGGIGTVRAHFYASFHSGRSTDNPISRDTLASITGLSSRTQRDYDRLAQVERQRNITVGPKHTKNPPKNNIGSGVGRSSDSWTARANRDPKTVSIWPGRCQTPIKRHTSSAQRDGRRKSTNSC